MSIQYRLEYAGFLAASSLLRALPHSFAGRLGRVGGRTYYRLNRSRRRLAQENIRQALPTLPEAEVKRVARASFEHHGAMFFEGASADRFADHELDELFELEGWEHVERLIEGGKGFFILSGHFGAIEQAMYPLTERLGSLHLVLKAQANPLVSENIRRMRAERGHTLIYPKQGGHRMLNAVRKGGRVALLIDQRVQPKDGALLPFLGRPAWTTIVLARLSSYSRRPVVPIYCVPLPEGRFRLEIEAPIVPGDRGLEAEIGLTRRYNESLEAQIRRRPELWYWMHSRWRLTVRHRWPQVLEKLLRESGLPDGFGQQQLEFDSLPKPARVEFDRLRRGAFLERCECVALTGPADCGRNRSAAVLVEALVRGGHPARYCDAVTLVDDLLARHREQDLTQAWFDLDRIELLALVDIDRLDTEDRSRMLLALLRQRHRRRSTLVTSTAAPLEWESGLANGIGSEARTLLTTPGTAVHLEGRE